MNKPAMGSLLALGISFGTLFAGPVARGEDSTAAADPFVKPCVRPRIFAEIKTRQGDTLWGLARRFGTTVDVLARCNGLSDPDRLKTGMTIRIPQPSAPGRGLRKPAPRPAVGRTRTTAMTRRTGETQGLLAELGPRGLLPPVSSGRLTSPFGYRSGRMHWGIDLACPQGTPVYAVAAGRVTYAGWRCGYGWTVEIDHGGFRSRYAHNSRLTAVEGQYVCAGDCIAVVGHTGRATGDHLHFELERDGRRVNPLDYLGRL